MIKICIKAKLDPTKVISILLCFKNYAGKLELYILLYFTQKLTLLISRTFELSS